MEEKSRHQFVRIWVELDMDHVRKHLILADESLGSCASCKDLGIDLKTARTCPNCGTEFLYATTRPVGSGKTADFKILSRIRVKRPDLTIIDWNDYDHGQGKLSARELLNL